MKHLPSYFTIPASVFAGAVVGFLQATPGPYWLSPATAKAAAMGALLAGLVAVVHFYMPSPVLPAAPASEVKS